MTSIGTKRERACSTTDPVLPSHAALSIPLRQRVCRKSKLDFVGGFVCYSVGLLKGHKTDRCGLACQLVELCTKICNRLLIPSTLLINSEHHPATPSPAHARAPRGSLKPAEPLSDLPAQPRLTITRSDPHTGPLRSGSRLPPAAPPIPTTHPHPESCPACDAVHCP
jgi:hypothetical protein